MLVASASERVALLADVLDCAYREFTDWIALLHKSLLGQRVLSVTSSSPQLRAYMHCARELSGGVVAMYINIDSRPTQVVLPLGSSTSDRNGYWEAEQWETWILTPGQRLPNAPNRLQSHGTLACTLISCTVIPRILTVYCYLLRPTCRGVAERKTSLARS